MDTLGPYRLNSIVTGDARILAKEIPDESVDLIFTDPVYQNIDDYRWLAETAARVLKPDSACLAWCNIQNLPTVVQKMCPPLRYVWILDWLRYSFKYYYGRTGLTVKTPCLWLEKGTAKPYKRFADLCSTGNTQASDGGHKWSKPSLVVSKWLDAFCLPNAIVLDPFTGGGTVPAVCKMLNRRYLAFEIEPDTAELARERVRNTQPPLPGLVVEQGELLGG